VRHFNKPAPRSFGVFLNSFDDILLTFCIKFPPTLALFIIGSPLDCESGSNNDVIFFPMVLFPPETAPGMCIPLSIDPSWYELFFHLSLDKIFPPNFEELGPSLLPIKKEPSGFPPYSLTRGLSTMRQLHIMPTLISMALLRLSGHTVLRRQKMLDKHLRPYTCSSFYPCRVCLPRETLDNDQSDNTCHDNTKPQVSTRKSSKAKV
jgi:hypothetical protein